MKWQGIPVLGCATFGRNKDLPTFCWNWNVKKSPCLGRRNSLTSHRKRSRTTWCPCRKWIIKTLILGKSVSISCRIARINAVLFSAYPAKEESYEEGTSDDETDSILPDIPSNSSLFKNLVSFRFFAVIVVFYF